MASVKGLSKEQAQERLELTKKQIAFNNELKKQVRKLRKEIEDKYAKQGEKIDWAWGGAKVYDSNISDWEYYTATTYAPIQTRSLDYEDRVKVVDLIEDELDKANIKEVLGEKWYDAYVHDAYNIIAGLWSVAENRDLNKDVKDYEKYIQTLDEITTNSKDTKEERHDDFGFSVERDLEHTRLNIYYDDIPSEEERTILKKNGFKWSPYLKAWTRQLTSNAEQCLTRVINWYETGDEYRHEWHY